MEPNLVDTNGEFLRSKILGKLGVQEVHLTTGSAWMPPEPVVTNGEILRSETREARAAWKLHLRQSCSGNTRKFR